MLPQLRMRPRLRSNILYLYLCRLLTKLVSPLTMNLQSWHCAPFPISHSYSISTKKTSSPPQPQSFSTSTRPAKSLMAPSTQTPTLGTASVGSSRHLSIAPVRTPLTMAAPVSTTLPYLILLSTRAVLIVLSTSHGLYRVRLLQRQRYTCTHRNMYGHEHWLLQR